MKIRFLFSLFQRKTHFISYLNSVFRFTLIILLFFFLILNNYSSVVAQVRIKEKIELKPSNAQNQKVKNLLPSASSNYFPCGPFMTSTDVSNPWQVVWIGSSYPMDVAQQAFNYQANSSSYMVNGNYTIEVMEGAENCSLVEVFRCDSITGECPDPISVDLGTKIENISHLDMEGEGDFMIWQGVPSRILSGYVRYVVRFIKPGNVTIRYSNTSGNVTDFHTLVVQPDYYLEYIGTGDLPYGEEDEINLRENIVQCQNEWSFWNGGSMPDYIKYNVNITEGQNYGKLILKSFDEDLFLEIRDTSDSFSEIVDTHGLVFASLGEAPNDSTKVKISYSTTDNTIQPIIHELKIIPNENYPLRVTMFPEELMPGDTSFITLEKRIDKYPFDDPNSIEYEDFEPGQLFNIKIEKGEKFGTIYSIVAEDTSDAFSQVEDGFFFLAKDTISVSSAEVKIRATAKIYTFDDPLTTSIVNYNNSTKNKGKNKNSLAIIGIPTGIEEIFGIGEVRIGESELDHFKLTIIPDTLSANDTLAFTETARVFVQAKDTDSNDVIIDSTSILRFEVTTNSNYGTFIDSNGDTLETTPVMLENISYADANAGRIKFAAVTENPDSTIKCNIKVSVLQDSSIKGNREAVVLEQTLKIVMTGNREVQPIITGRRHDPEHDTYLNHITQNNRKPFIARLTRGGVKVNNHKFRLNTNYIDESGGHDHTEQRRPDSAFSYTRSNEIKNIPSERARSQNYGSFYSYSSGITFNTDSLKGMKFERSGQDTVTRFEYVASIWGDEMKIYLESLENRLLNKDSVTIIERIPNLQALGTHENYTLVGGTEQHNGPQQHQVDHNHFGTTTTNTNIRNIAAEYRQRIDTLLIINDMSVPNGGKFDINGSWRGSHCDHRTGVNVDIRSRDMIGDRYLDANENGIYDPEIDQNERLLNDNNGNGEYDGEHIEIFREISSDNNARWILLENPNDHNGYAEHWHLEF